MEGRADERDKTRRLRIWLPCLAPVVLIVFGAGLAIVLWFASGRAQLNRALADLKAAGIPTSISQITPPTIPDAENAAQVYQRAWALLGETPDDVHQIVGTSLRVPLSQLPREARRTIMAWLDRKRPASDLAKVAARFDKCRLPLRYEDGILIRLPELSNMLRLTQLLQVDAAERLDRGDLSGALDSAFAIRAMARHCASHSLLTCKFAAFACYGRSADALDLILQHARLPTVYLEGILVRLTKERPDADLRDAFESEICFGMDAYNGLRTKRLTPADLGWPGKAGGLQTAWLRWVADRDEAAYLKAMRGYRELSDKPYFEIKARADAIQGQIEAAGYWPCPMATLTTPALGGAFTATGRVEARYQIQRLAVASMIYRKKHGRYPDKLEELAPTIMPEIPIDPFSGKPYVYRREGKGFVVYSLDQNMKDDGGVPRLPRAKKGDIVFRFPG
jgi:hypothetical protein